MKRMRMAASVAMLLVLVGCGSSEDKDSLTTTDKAYVKTLRKEITGVKGTADKTLVKQGHDVCVFAENVETFQGVIAWTATETELTESDSAYLAGAAIAAYCPQHLSMIPGS